MTTTRSILIGLAVLGAGSGLMALDSEHGAESLIHARLEFVDSTVALAYQNTTGQLIDLLAEKDSRPPAQLLATTDRGLGYLYLREVDPGFTLPTDRTYWSSLTGTEPESSRAREADGLVRESRDLLLRYRPELSYHPEPSRLGYDRAGFQFFFIYGVPRGQRHAYEAMSRDYNKLSADTGVLVHSDVYELIEVGDELRHLVVKASAGNADFWRLETGLDAKIAGERFDQIGLAAEAMMSSVETMTAIRLSQGRAPSPLLRHRP